MEGSEADGMIVKRVSVPLGLEELMEGLTKEVLLKKPDDIYLFAAEYFSKLLSLRDKGSYKVKTLISAQSVTRQSSKQPVEKLLIRGASKQLSRQISVRGESPLKKNMPIRRSMDWKDQMEDKSTDMHKFIEMRNRMKHSAPSENKNTESKPIATVRANLVNVGNKSNTLNKRDRSVSTSRRGRSVTTSVQSTPRQKSTSRTAINDSEQSKSEKSYKRDSRTGESLSTSKNKREITSENMIVDKQVALKAITVDKNVTLKVSEQLLEADNNKIESDNEFKDKPIPKTSSVEETNEFIRDGKLTVSPPHIVIRPKIPENHELISTLIVPQIVGKLSSTEDINEHEVEKTKDIIDNTEENRAIDFKEIVTGGIIKDDINKKDISVKVIDEEFKKSRDEEEKPINRNGVNKLNLEKNPLEKDVLISSVASSSLDATATEISTISKLKSNTVTDDDLKDKKVDFSKSVSLSKSGTEEQNETKQDPFSAKNEDDGMSSCTDITQIDNVVNNHLETPESLFVEDVNVVDGTESNKSSTILDDNAKHTDTQIEYSKTGTISLEKQNGTDKKSNDGVSEGISDIDNVLKIKNNNIVNISQTETISSAKETLDDTGNKVKESDLLHTNEIIDYVKNDTVSNDTNDNRYDNNLTQTKPTTANDVKNVDDTAEREDNVSSDIVKQVDKQDDLSITESSTERELEDQNIQNDAQIKVEMNNEKLQKKEDIKPKQCDKENTDIDSLQHKNEENVDFKITEDNIQTTVEDSLQNSNFENESKDLKNKAKLEDQKKFIEGEEKSETNMKHVNKISADGDLEPTEFKIKSGSTVISEKYVDSVKDREENIKKNEDETLKISEQGLSISIKANLEEEHSIIPTNPIEGKDNIEHQDVAVNSGDTEPYNTRTTKVENKIENRQLIEDTEERKELIKETETFPTTGVVGKHFQENKGVTNFENENNKSIIPQDKGKGNVDVKEVDTSAEVLNDDNTNSPSITNRSNKIIDKRDPDITKPDITKPELEYDISPDVLDDDISKPSNATNESNKIIDETDKMIIKIESENLESLKEKDKDSYNNVQDNNGKGVEKENSATISSIEKLVSNKEETITMNEKQEDAQGDQRHEPVQGETKNDHSQIDSTNKEGTLVKTEDDVLLENSITESAEEKNIPYVNVDSTDQTLLKQDIQKSLTNGVEKLTTNENVFVEGKEQNTDHQEIQKEVISGSIKQEHDTVICEKLVERNDQSKICTELGKNGKTNQQIIDKVSENTQIDTKNMNIESGEKQENKEKQDIKIDVKIKPVDILLESGENEHYNSIKDAEANIAGTSTEPANNSSEGYRPTPKDNTNANPEESNSIILEQDTGHVSKEILDKFYANNAQEVGDTSTSGNSTEGIPNSKDSHLGSEKVKQKSVKIQHSEETNKLIEKAIMSSSIDENISETNVFKEKTNTELQETVFEAKHEVNDQDKHILSHDTNIKNVINSVLFVLKEKPIDNILKTYLNDFIKKEQDNTFVENLGNVNEPLEINDNRAREKVVKTELSAVNTSENCSTEDAASGSEEGSTIRRKKSANLLTKRGSRESIDEILEDEKSNVLVVHQADKGEIDGEKFSNIESKKKCDTNTDVEEGIPPGQSDQEELKLVSTEVEESKSSSIEAQSLKKYITTDSFDETVARSINTFLHEEKQNVFGHNIEEANTPTKTCQDQENHENVDVKHMIEGGDTLKGLKKTVSDNLRESDADKISNKLKEAPTIKHSVKKESTALLRGNKLSEGNSRDNIKNGRKMRRVKTVDVISDTIRAKPEIKSRIPTADSRSRVKRDTDNGKHSVIAKPIRGKKVKSETSENEDEIDKKRSIDDSSNKDTINNEIVEGHVDKMERGAKENITDLQKSSFHLSQLHTELKAVQDESRLSNFKSSYNPYVLRQEIKNASLDETVSSEHENISTGKYKLSDVVAAIKIQSLWRGYIVRKNKVSDDAALKLDNEPNKCEDVIENEANKNKNQLNSTENMSSRDIHNDVDNKLTHEEKNGSNKLNDNRLVIAATKIQAIWRGFQIRKFIKQNDQQNGQPKLVQLNSNADILSKDNTMVQPELKEKFAKAALKIQALWRGFQLRKTINKKDRGNERISQQTQDEIEKTNAENSKYDKIMEIEDPKSAKTEEESENQKSNNLQILTVQSKDGKDNKNLPVGNRDSLKDDLELSKSTEKMVNCEENKCTYQPVEGSVSSSLNDNKSDLKDISVTERKHQFSNDSNDKIIRAAILIQKIWRGFNVRRSLNKNPPFGTKVDIEHSIVEVVEAKDKIEQKDRKSALKIQSLWRGYQVRKNIGIIKNKLEDKSASDTEVKRAITDGDILNAATKIQAGVRGYLQRKRYKGSINKLNSITEEDEPGNVRDTLLHDNANSAVRSTVHKESEVRNNAIAKEELEKVKESNIEKYLSEAEVVKALEQLNKLEIPEEPPELPLEKNNDKLNFYRSNTVQETEIIKEQCPLLHKSISLDSNNNPPSTHFSKIPVEHKPKNDSNTTKNKTYETEDKQILSDQHNDQINRTILGTNQIQTIDYDKSNANGDSFNENKEFHDNKDKINRKDSENVNTGSESNITSDALEQMNQRELKAGNNPDKFHDKSMMNHETFQDDVSEPSNKISKTDSFTKPTEDSTNNVESQMDDNTKSTDNLAVIVKDKPDKHKLSKERMSYDTSTSVDSTDSTVTVVGQSEEIKRDIESCNNASQSENELFENVNRLVGPGDTKETFLEPENLINEFQNKLLDQISGKNGENISSVEGENAKFNIEQLRKELKEAGLIYNNEDNVNIIHQNSKEESHDELLEYLNNFGTENGHDERINPDTSRISSLRDLPDIKEEELETKFQVEGKHEENVKNSGTNISDDSDRHDNTGTEKNIQESEVNIQKIQSTLRECENIAKEINMGFKIIEPEHEGNNKSDQNKEDGFCKVLVSDHGHESKFIDNKPLSDHVELIETNQQDRKDIGHEKTEKAINDTNDEINQYVHADVSSAIEDVETSTADNKVLHTGDLHDAITSTTELTSREGQELKDLRDQLLPNDKSRVPDDANSTDKKTESIHQGILKDLEHNEDLRISAASSLPLKTEQHNLSNVTIQSNNETTPVSVVSNVDSKGVAKDSVLFKQGINVTTELLHTGELHDTVLVTIPIINSNKHDREKDTSEASLSKQHPSNSQGGYSGVLHEGEDEDEVHDTVMVPLAKTTQRSDDGQEEEGNKKEDTPQRVDGESQTTGDSIAVQLNQAPAGVAVLTSPRSALGDDGDDGDVIDVDNDIAQASDKGVSPVRPDSDFSAPSDLRSMESEKRKNATINNKSMEVEAATKIQAGFRGYQVRKQLKLKNGSSDIKNNQRRQARRKSSGRINETGRITQNRPKEQNDIEEKSAVKIQAGVRGFLVRRRQKKQKNQES